MVAALLCLFGIFAFGVGVSERADLRRFIKGLLYGLFIEPVGAFIRPSRNAWTSVYFVASLAVVLFLLHFLFIRVFGFTGVAEVVFKLVVIALCLLALIFVTVAVDDAITKPFLSSLDRYKDQSNLDALIQGIKKIVASVIAVVGVIVGLIELFQ